MIISTKVDPRSPLLTNQDTRDRMTEYVKALLSDQFSKIVGRLSHPEAEQQFCSMGVACELAPLGSWENRPEIGRVYVLANSESYFRLKSPEQVVKYFGFYCPSESNYLPGCFYDIQGHTRWLAIAFMNDTLKLPFYVIAKSIEQTYLTGWGK